MGRRRRILWHITHKYTKLSSLQTFAFFCSLLIFNQLKILFPVQKLSQIQFVPPSSPATAPRNHATIIQHVIFSQTKALHHRHLLYRYGCCWFTKYRVQLEWEPGFLVTKRPLRETFLRKKHTIIIQHLLFSPS